MRECARPGCGQPLVRGRTEALSAWNARRCCSRACSSALTPRGAVVANPPEEPYDHPPCVVCGKAIVRRSSEGRGEWRAREACSRACGLYLGQSRGAATMAARAQVAPKPCAVCGKTMTRNYQESRARFAARTTCSRTCWAKAQSRPAAIKLDKPVAVGRPPQPTGLRPCVCCGRDIPWPPGWSPSKYRTRVTCGAETCKNQQATRPVTGGPAELVADVATLMRPSPKQRAAWLQATESERRLFAPEIRAAMGRGA